MTDRPARRARGASAPATAPGSLGDLTGLRERMNRLLEALLRKGEYAAEGAGLWAPPADLREERQSFVLSCEVPGVRPEDLSVRVEGGVVIVEGRRPLESEARFSLRVERPYGRFSRTFRLPVPVDENGVNARLHLGVLEVVLPKAPGARPRPLKVRVESW